MNALVIPSLPGICEWKHQPLDWKLEAGNTLRITAGKNTDWFIDPAGSYSKDNAPAALFTPADPNCIFSAKVIVAFASAFDAGALQARVHDTLWAKLCFEYSPQGQPMIVSVVTRGLSDDCNSVVIAGQEIYLRIVRTLRTLAFHYSADGRYWHFVRYFTLGEMANVQMGFSSQSPTGERCTAVFSEIAYRAGTLKDNRSGE